MESIRTWSSFRKIAAIIILASSLGGFLYFRHLLLQEDNNPTLVDRMPEGDFMIRANILDIAKETSALMHSNKVKFRDFISHEFLLGQAKNYGLDLIAPTYIFANESGEWGALIAVMDSSKIRPGINRLQQTLDIKDTNMFRHPVYYWKEEKARLSFGENWLFIYKGENFKKHLFQIVNTEQGGLLPKWAEFLAEEKFKNQKLVLSSRCKKLRDIGIEKALIAHDNDSSHFSVLTYFKAMKPWSFSAREKGKSLNYNTYTDRFLNVHMNVPKWDTLKKDPLYKVLQKWSRKIAFPLKEFFIAWQGDLSFVQGGYQVITETYIETEMDENFNRQEVSKTRELRVPGFSLALSMNKNAPLLLSILRERGILTDEEDKVRFLFSPPLNYSVKENYHLFYSGEYSPKLVKDNFNNGLWNEKGTKFNFQLDSLNEFEAFGSMIFPVEKLIQRNKFF
jgi:hypothetical protein